MSRVPVAVQHHRQRVGLQAVERVLDTFADRLPRFSERQAGRNFSPTLVTTKKKSFKPVSASALSSASKRALQTVKKWCILSDPRQQIRNEYVGEKSGIRFTQMKMTLGDPWCRGPEKAGSSPGVIHKRTMKGDLVAVAKTDADLLDCEIRLTQEACGFPHS